MTALDPFLGEAYKARVLERRSSDPVAERLLKAMRDDPEFDKSVRAAAQRYAAANGCFISQTHAEFLNSALDKLNGS